MIKNTIATLCYGIAVVPAAIAWFFSKLAEGFIELGESLVDPQQSS